MRRGILIVDDDPTITRLLTSVVAELAPVRVEHSAPAARAALASERFCGLIVDVNLAGESGLDVLAAARQGDPTLPALVLTGYADHVFINRAFALGASYACKPIDERAIVPFVRRALAAAEVPHERLTAMVDHVAREHSLTRSETKILLAALAGHTRAAILKDRGVSANTHRTQVRSLLRKLEAASLDELVTRLLRTVVSDTSGVYSTAGASAAGSASARADADDDDDDDADDADDASDADDDEAPPR